MSTSKISDENYFTIHGWMLNRLGLKGSDLQVYAIVYGFSQDGKSEFSGSLRYLQDFTGLSRQTVINSLNALVDANLIIKIATEINGMRLPKYKVNLEAISAGKNYTGSTNFIPGSKEIIPNKLVDSNTPSFNSVSKDTESKDEEYIVEEASTSHIPTERSKKESTSLEDFRKTYITNTKTDNDTQVVEVIEFLNSVTDKNYRATTPETKKMITARLNEGYTVDDMKRVIEHRWEMWRGTDMEQYMRPNTLFRPSKFENYLNAVGTKRKLGSRGCTDTLAIFGVKPQKSFSELSEEEQTKSLAGRKF